MKTVPLTTVPVTSAPAPDLATAPRRYPVSRPGVRAVALRGERWRITREHGEVLGYVERVVAPGSEAERWRVSRMPHRQSRLRLVGEFDSPVDALDVVRRG